jgi:NAD-dependent deacetylase
MDGRSGVTGASLLPASELLSDARSVTILTGAGISAESGVPTFRGAAGLWRSHRPEDLATPEAFARDPALVWSWYRWRRGLVARCAPNEGHRAIARFALDGTHTVTLVTQNVDGLHQRAAEEHARTRDASPGCPLELHGSLMRDRCSGCGRRSPAPFPIAAHPDAATPADVVDPPPDGNATALYGSVGAPERVPRCQACGSMLRPDVVWFGEVLDPDVLDRAFQAASDADLCLVVGTSSLVHPAASLPLAALAAGRPVIEINLDPTPLSRLATVALSGTAGALLPALLSAPEG